MVGMCLIFKIGEAPVTDVEPVEETELIHSEKYRERKKDRASTPPSFSQRQDENQLPLTTQATEGTVTTAGARKRKRKHSSKGGQLGDDNHHQEGDISSKNQVARHKHKFDGKGKEDRSHKPYRASGLGSSGSGSDNKADMKKIKALKSGKMMSIKKLTEELQK